MKTRGELTGIQLNFRTKRPVISFEIQADPADLEKYIGKDLDLTFTQHRDKRSKDANALLWACIGDIAKAINTDNWSVYLYELRRYGEYTTLLIRPEAVARMRETWRETEIVGEQDGMILMNCYFGSSTYNTKEMSRLIDGAIEDMKMLHLETPANEELRQIISAMERREAREREKQNRTKVPEQGQDRGA